MLTFYRSLLHVLLFLIPILGMSQASEFRQSLWQLDAHINSDELEAARALVLELRQNIPPTALDTLRLIDKEIALADKGGTSAELISLLTRFVDHEFAQENYQAGLGFGPFKQDSFPYSLLQWKMATHARSLAKHLIQSGAFQEGLDRLDQQVVSYPFHPPCGSTVDWNMEYDEYASLAHFGIGNYDLVIQTLLPYSFYRRGDVGFEYNPGIFEVDSLLYLSLRTKYTDAEIRAELDASAERAAEEEHQGSKSAFLIFGYTIESSLPYWRCYREQAKIYSNKELGFEERQQDIQELRKRCIREIVQDMRLYQHLKDR